MENIDKINIKFNSLSQSLISYKNLMKGKEERLKSL